MKRILILLLLLNAGGSFAQEEIIVTEEIQNYLLGDKNSIVVTVPYGEASLIEKQLKREMKAWGGSFYVNRGEYTLVQGKLNTLGFWNNQCLCKNLKWEQIRTIKFVLLLI
jgi:hypothetical protein